MKPEIHPEYRDVVFLDTQNGTSFITRSTIKTEETTDVDGVQYPLAKVEISAASHPFYTGTMTIIDTAGRVERFEKRYGRRKQKGGAPAAEDAPVADEAPAPVEDAPAAKEAPAPAVDEAPAEEAPVADEAPAAEEAPAPAEEAPVADEAPAAEEAPAPAAEEAPAPVAEEAPAEAAETDEEE